MTTRIFRGGYPAPITPNDSDTASQTAPRALKAASGVRRIDDAPEGERLPATDFDGPSAHGANWQTNAYNTLTFTLRASYSGSDALMVAPLTSAGLSTASPALTISVEPNAPPV